jgi:hypothetical protein
VDKEEGDEGRSTTCVFLRRELTRTETGESESGIEIMNSSSTSA